MFDYIIRGGSVIDGSGSEPVRADIAVSEGKIAAVTRNRDLTVASARRIIDADGKVVCPGFIDTHSHSDLMVLSSPSPEPKVRQGVTTELLAQDGLSVAPVPAGQRELLKRLVSSLLGLPRVDWTWTSFAEYLAALDRGGMPVNAAALVPHGPIRMAAMGMEARVSTAAELATMERILDEALSAGGVGLSTGMIYPPCSFADDRELIALCRVTARHGGIFVIHMRNESELLIESVKETLAIAEQSGVALHISHLKAAGHAAWPKVDAMMNLLSDGLARGMKITWDQYPYTAGCTVLTATLPPWTLEGGTPALLARLASPEGRRRINHEFAESPRMAPAERAERGIATWDNRQHTLGWENITISSVKSQANSWCQGLSIAEIAHRRGHPPEDTIMDLLLEEDADVNMILHQGSEARMKQVMAAPQTIACTDGIYGGKPHPRLYGSYPRILGKYARDEKVISLPEAIRKMTSLPARVLGLSGRGLIRQGYSADVVVFDPATVIDRGTYERPNVYPVGIDYVLVNGALAIDGGAYTGARAGRALVRQFPA